jgi:hypothetical protein
MFVERVSSPVLSSIENDLAIISELADGWYGVGSVSVSESVLGRARQTAKIIAGVRGLGAPEITPTPNGTVSFEWETENTSVYIEIGRTRMNGFLKVAGDEATILPSAGELPKVFFQGLSELLAPSRGSSFALPEGSASETVPLVA